ncbi:papain-like cysteine protease family protein [Streptomyces pathocidini]|uniref:papain-like cysteine protease family protein n=1 Tax=Streptomyces pathocidini TaxID=1650571 RepID=UPI003F4CE8FA
MPGPRRRPALTALTTLALTAALLALPTATAGAATAAAPSKPPAGADTKRLDITMQAQRKTNWCWAAAGNTIATWFGQDRSQNEFCNAAFNHRQGGDCPNSQAALDDVQTGLSWTGVNSGSYVANSLSYSTVRAEIDADRPLETRIRWSSGGGHMHVIYGYDAAGSWVYWGDPWPSSERYSWASHSWYVDNSEFAWTHSLYRIGA